MSDDQEKKIVVDDDWKEQVRKEREELRKKDTSSASDDEESRSQASQASQASHEAAAAGAEESSAGDENQAVKPLPASLEGLVSMLATQAMVSMGAIPGPGGEAAIDRDFAKHFIDLLGIVEEKTKGNLTDGEAQMLTQVLHDLRMGFVQMPG